MCVVSMVSDRIGKIEPYEQPWNYPGFPEPSIPSKTIDKLTPEDLIKISKILKDALEFDKETNQPECSDPEKTEKLKFLRDEIRQIANNVSDYSANEIQSELFDAIYVIDEILDVV